MQLLAAPRLYTNVAGPLTPGRVLLGPLGCQDRRCALVLQPGALPMLRYDTAIPYI